MYTIKDSASHFPQMDKALLFKMACNQEDQLNSLLSYYRGRINDFDAERCEWLKILNEVISQESEKHKLDWELQRRRDEVGSLKLTLDQFKANLYQERQNVLAESKENELLVLKNLEDKKKIAELNALIEPIQINIVLEKNKKPDVSCQYSKTEGSINRSKQNFDGILKKQLQILVGKDGLSQGESRCIVKNVHMSNDSADQVEKENSQFREEIDSEREVWIARIQDLTDKIHEREKQIKEGNGNSNAKIEQLIQNCQKLEKQNLDLSKELLSFKVQTSEQERRQQEENELMRLKNTAIANKLLIIQKQSLQQNQKCVQDATKISMGAASQFKNQIRTKDENIQIIKEQYNQVQKIYLAKMKQIEEDLISLSEKYDKCDEKRKVANTSYKSEIKILTNKIEQISSQIAEHDAQNEEQEQEEEDQQQ